MEEIAIRQTSGSFECDFAKAKEMLKNELEVYSTIVFTEDTKKEAKDTVADLRKKQKALNDRAKEVEKEYLIPLNDFKSKVRELSDSFNEPIFFINDQINAFEERRIADKKAQCKAIYDELIPEEDIRSALSYLRIYNPKWENATFTAKQIKEEIMTRKVEFKSAMEVIANMNSEVTDKAIDIYLKNFSLPEAVTFITNHEQQKAEILRREAERLKREAEEKANREAEEKLEAERKRLKALEAQMQANLEAAVNEAKADAIESFIPVETEEEPTAYQYTLFLTSDAKSKVDMFLDSIGIEYYEREL